jgi:hypothetical protein
VVAKREGRAGGARRRRRRHHLVWWFSVGSGMVGVRVCGGNSGEEL